MGSTGAIAATPRAKVPAERRQRRRRPTLDILKFFQHSDTGKAEVSSA